MLALLCCGLRRRPHDQSDERTPLIPHADDTPTPQPRVIDQQRLKERLGSVVRSKEGKMVNVSAQCPFNLHNHDHQAHSSSASSRNVSGGTLPSSRAASPSPQRHLHKTRSDASFHPDGDDASHYLPLSVNASAPVLSVRLVKSARSTPSARGRPQRCGDLNTDEEHTPRAPPPSSTLDQLSVDTETPRHHAEDFHIFDAGAVSRSWGD